jgi:hypothetical protein
MEDAESRTEGVPRASAKPDWDEEAIIEQIWHDLQGVIDRSTIGHELAQVISRFHGARVKTFVSIFLHRQTVERLRAKLADPVPAGTAVPAGTNGSDPRAIAR